MEEARGGSPLPTPHSLGSGEWGPYTPLLGFTTLLKIEPNV